MNIQEEVSLKQFNTFNLDCKAKYLIEIDTVEDLKEALLFSKDNNHSWFILGGGSNVILPDRYDGVVILNRLQGIDVLESLEDKIKIKVSGGENWHQLVTTCLKNNWFGLENLALIPGSVGAAPVQNIGAYGVELKDFFVELEAWDCQNNQLITLDILDCDFSYRNSVFKENPGRYIILSVTLQLSTEPKINIFYQALSDRFKDRSEISPQDVYEAVIDIRESKLPNPEKIPNAGSFFKNPIVDKEKYNSLSTQFPDLVSFPVGSHYKLAAGWLIDKAGWKGESENDIRVHDKQALVLTNLANASSSELLSFAKKIQDDIQSRYGVELEIEPVTI